MSLSIRSVIHGVVDPTFAARTATQSIAPGQSVLTEPERVHVEHIRDSLEADLAKEVNRIEGQLSLMLSHTAGEWESKLAIASMRTRIAPASVGIIFGFALGVFVKTYFF